MNNPALAFHSLPKSDAGWRRYAGIVFAALLNGALVWAMANGLAVKLGIYTPPAIDMKVIDTQQTQQQPRVVPPPQPQMEKIVPAEQTPEPVIQVAPDQSAQTIQVQPQQPPVQAIDASASGMLSTHTTPPYPPTARALAQQGRVILSITVGTDGAVTAAQVASSSGVPELDQAALEWVKAHWRYKPALRGGIAVTSMTQAAVKFDLKQTR